MEANEFRRDRWGSCRKKRGQRTDSIIFYLCDPFPRLYDLEQRQHESWSGRVGGVLQVALCVRALGRGRGSQEHCRRPVAADGSREESQDIPRGEGLARKLLGSSARWGEHVGEEQRGTAEERALFRSQLVESGREERRRVV